MKQFRPHPDNRVKNIEYCPNGHQNNLNIVYDDNSRNIQGVCPVDSCEYSGVST